MTVFVPSRLARLAFFTVAAGCAGFISAEAMAVTLAILITLAACCRDPIRLELVFAGMAAFAARHSGGTWHGFQAALFVLLPLVVAAAGLYVMARAVFGPRADPYKSRRRGRTW